MKLTRNHLCILLLLPVVAGSFLAGWYAKSRIAAKPVQKSVRLGQVHLVNPLISCEIGHGEVSANLPLTALKQKIETVIDRSKRSNEALDASVYFYDLSTDTEIEINGDAGFEPASLVKLPLMMEYFKRAESDPGILSRKLTYDGAYDWTRDQNYRPSKTLVPGKSYTVEDLIFRMLVRSDNNAFRTLLTDVDRVYLQKIHGDMGIETVMDASGAKLVTARSYSIFLKALYNSSFLNQEMSEKALSFLSANEFHLGIDATVPNTITVASKFGERTTGAHGEIKQLHDYGIVYYPQHPYLICIMTKGTDFAKLTELIRAISKTVYDEYDERYKSGK